MINTLVEKWVCTSFFQPDTYLESLDKYGTQLFEINPAHLACGGLDTVGNYFIVAAVVGVVLFNVLLFLFAAMGADKDTTIGWSVLSGLAGGALWPVTTLALPLGFLGWISWRLGKGLSNCIDEQHFRVEQEQLEESARLQELKPYIDALDDEIGTK